MSSCPHFGAFVRNVAEGERCGFIDPPADTPLPIFHCGQGATPHYCSPDHRVAPKVFDGRELPVRCCECCKWRPPLTETSPQIDDF